ncbi:MAG: helix-turn-helix transcriptional regulator [Desulfobulbus sp.]|jgi:DNA-binding XRE family transcriptional regulator|nr:helix-turn-helix transcriptional regulator [Desulfobulbus sp.]
MLARTKKHPTEIELRFKGPEHKRIEAVNVLREMGFTPVDTTTPVTPWQTAFPALEGNAAGVYLAGARHREGLTQHQLAERCGLPQRHISEMENGKRPIGKENAKRLAAALHVDYRVFL